jgi:DNA repair photolyase
MIYRSGGQAWEYAPLSVSPYLNCGHRCVYCFVPHIRQITRQEFDSGAVARKGFIARLKRDAVKSQEAGIIEQVLGSFMSDVYHPFDTSLTRRTWEVLIAHGLGFCGLSKGGTRALRDLDLFRPSRDSYAATLTSLDDSFASTWEPGAALPSDRIAAMRAFAEAGIFVWTSLEPVLSLQHTLDAIKATAGFVSHYKIGKANYLGALTKNTDWADYTLRIIDLLKRLGKSHYVKLDLQPYLPEGYYNPLRVVQHN